MNHDRLRLKTASRRVPFSQNHIYDEEDVSVQIIMNEESTHETKEDKPVLAGEVELFGQRIDEDWIIFFLIFLFVGLMFLYTSLTTI